MPTLWEILTKKKEPPKPLELCYCNPLELRLGNTVKINTVDYQSLNFIFTCLREVKRIIIPGQASAFYADYNLLASPYGAEKVQLRMRLVPIDAETKEIIDYDVVIFNKVSECEYSKEFHDSLQDQEEFVEGDATYWRVNDNKNSISCEVTIIDRSELQPKERPVVQQMTYWDFWREVELEGVKVLEFYIVEMNSSGYFEFWIGRKIDSARISVI